MAFLCFIIENLGSAVTPEFKKEVLNIHGL